MRFMIIVRATAETEAEVQPAPDPALLQAMAGYHTELARAGVLLDGAGLRPSRDGWRVLHAAGSSTPYIVDGPYAETKELIAGYTLIQVRSREEAVEWSRRFPNPMGAGREAVVEVRQLWELEDFPPGPEIEQMRHIEAGPHGGGGAP